MEQGIYFIENILLVKFVTIDIRNPDWQYLIFLTCYEKQKGTIYFRFILFFGREGL